MTTKTKKAGGARPGAGTKKQYKEDTRNITFRVPISFAPILREYVNGELQKLKIK